MCQLLGVSSNKKVDINFTIREFHRRGTGNPHGWGFAFYQDGDWKIIKEPSSLSAKDIKNGQYTINLKKIKAPDERAIIIATEPLTVNEKWKRIKGLMVFREGCLFP